MTGGMKKKKKQGEKKICYLFKFMQYSKNLHLYPTI